MKLINPSVEIWEQEVPDLKINMSHVQEKELLLNAIYKQIEKAGRTCYKSEDKITDDSAYPFVKRLIDSDHLAMLEHGTVYLYIVIPKKAWNKELVDKYYRNKYTKCNNSYDEFNYYYYITTNLRVIIENGWEKDLEYICIPTKHHEKRITAHFICNRQVSHEFVRHRVFSFAQESTRYCNYTKGKFGSELTFIQPCWDTHSPVPSGYGDTFNEVLQKIEWSYNRLIELGWKPQQAATILPNAIKTELVMTGFEEDWKHFIELRSIGVTGAPHPQAKELADKVKEYFDKVHETI